MSLESGNELVAKFTEERQNMKIAIGALLTEGNEIATIEPSTNPIFKDLYFFKISVILSMLTI